ncbi:uncharacterized protein LOC141701367 [Apium graveolens]|uniref:C2H2-type domain-containing protein n=1 Tax=Apium graveolens TaxID=4045 RepID=A0A6L5B9V6_APIGR|nr:hypothetical protein AG4045_015280 [Apium graveolens]
MQLLMVSERNRKKTYRFKDSSEDTLLHVDKICKECGKDFPSWKALFGHMKCHSDKITRTRVDEQDSGTSADQSENGKVNPRKKRSVRRTKRYFKMEISGTTATSSSLSCNANTTASVSEIEQEQEEVALCLIMLSKDVSNWSGLKSIGESSVNNSEFVDAQSFTKTEGKQVGGDEIVKLKKKLNGNLRDGPKMNRSEIKVGGLIMLNDKLKSKVVEELEFQVSEVEIERTLINASKSDEESDLGTKKLIPSKRKEPDFVGPEYKVNNMEMIKIGCDQRRKYECPSCNKAFNTFQALGGHRASNKKMKGCFGLINSCENRVIAADLRISPIPPADNRSLIAHEMTTDTSNGTKKIIKGGSHECQICFRVFSSGQALGGHKRSHLIAEAKNSQGITSSSIVIQKPVPEIRDFLDLNLPAPEEDDISTSEIGFRQWWMGNNNHEALLGLL